MSDTVIRVENLSKKYMIGHQQQERYPALRDVVANGAKALLRSFRGGRLARVDPAVEEFWALKDVVMNEPIEFNCAGINRSR